MKHAPGARTQAERRRARAAEWLFRLRNPEVSSMDIRDWLAWCEAARENKQEFGRMQEIWQRAGAIRQVPDDVAALVSARPPVARPRGPRFGGARWLLAASVAVTVVSVGWWVLDGRKLAANDVTLATTVGVNRDAILPDGSTVILAAGSRLATHYTATERRVVLEHGEAFFSVRKDPRRPFVVRALDATVTAVGTAFNVRAEQGLVRVAVTEGIVDVERPQISGESPAKGREPPAQTPSPAPPRVENVRVAAGHQITLLPHNPEPVLISVGAERAAAWRTGALQFEREPLASVIAAVNRYASVPIVMGSDTVGQYHYTGTVATDRIDEWLRGLPDIYPITIRRQDGARVFIEPAAAAAGASATGR